MAVVLAGLAIAEISNRGRKGLGLALGGMALGLCDVVGWIVAMMFIFRGGPVGPHPTGQQISEADLKMLSAPIAQAVHRKPACFPEQLLCSADAEPPARASSCAEA